MAPNLKPVVVFARMTASWACVRCREESSLVCLSKGHLMEAGLGLRVKVLATEESRSSK